MPGQTRPKQRHQAANPPADWGESWLWLFLEQHLTDRASLHQSSCVHAASHLRGSNHLQPTQWARATHIYDLRHEHQGVGRDIFCTGSSRGELTLCPFALLDDKYVTWLMPYPFSSKSASLPHVPSSLILSISTLFYIQGSLKPYCIQKILEDHL